MDTEKIKTLLLAIERKSFSKAAEDLSYTPSALSHIADSVENDLGIKLLNRSFSGVELNENGKLIIDKLYNLINAEEELYLFADKLKASPTHLKIGTYSSVAQHLLPEIIKKFKQENPDIKLSIKVGNTITNWLNDDSVDIIFSDRHSPNCCWTELLSDPFYVIAHKDILQNRKTVSKSELYNFTYIIHTEGILSNYFELNKFKDVIKFESVDESSIVSMVEKNLGIAVLPKLMLKNKSKLTHMLSITPQISRTIGFSYKPETKNSNVIKFANFVKENFPHKDLSN